MEFEFLAFFPDPLKVRVLVVLRLIAIGPLIPGLPAKAALPTPGCVGGALGRIHPVDWLELRPLTRHEQPMEGKVLDPKRLKERVRIYSVGTPEYAKALAGLKDVDDACYIYGFDARGRLAVMNRNALPAGMEPDEADGFVGSHEGLRIALEAYDAMHGTGGPIEWVATGEIVRRGGTTRVVSNASGTWRGDSKSLVYARMRLQQGGLPLDETTRYLDFSRRADPHAMASRQVRAEYRVSQDPVKTRLLQATRKLFRKLPKDGSLSEKMLLILEREPFEVSGAFAPSAVQLTQDWVEGIEGEELMVDFIVDQLGEEGFERLLGLIEKYAAAKP